MAGRIGSVQRAQDGRSYSFVLYDEQDRACMYLGFSTWHDADRAAGVRAAVTEGQGLVPLHPAIRRVLRRLEAFCVSWPGGAVLIVLWVLFLWWI